MGSNKEQGSAQARSEPAKKGKTRNLYIKNSSPVPNWYLDSFLEDPDIPNYVHVVFLFLLRRTIGWDKLFEMVSYDDITNGTGETKRTHIQHAIFLLCDWWGLFSLEPGKGKRKSRFTVEDWSNRDTVLDRKLTMLFSDYDSGFPSVEEFRAIKNPKEIVQECYTKAQATWAKNPSNLDGQSKEAAAVVVPHGKR